MWTWCVTPSVILVKHDQFGFPTSEGANYAENTSEKERFRNVWPLYDNQHEKSIGIDVSLQKMIFSQKWPIWHSHQWRGQRHWKHIRKWPIKKLLVTLRKSARKSCELKCYSKKWFLAKNDEFGIPTSEEAKDAENTSENDRFRNFWSLYDNQHKKSCGIGVSLQKVILVKNDQFGIPTSEEAKDAENTSKNDRVWNFWSLYDNQHKKSCGIDVSLQKVIFCQKWPI